MPNLNKEHATINLKGIADVCLCSVEVVGQFLNKMKEQVAHQVQKGKTVSLNMLIGQLIHKDKQVEFKSNNLDIFGDVQDVYR